MINVKIIYCNHLKLTFKNHNMHTVNPFGAKKLNASRGWGSYLQRCAKNTRSQELLQVQLTNCKDHGDWYILRRVVRLLHCGCDHIKSHKRKEGRCCSCEDA